MEQCTDTGIWTRVKPAQETEM